MIAKTLITFSELLDDHLKRVFNLTESIVYLQSIMNNSISQMPDNKIHIFLSNIERETAGGITSQRQALGNMQKNASPEWNLNLYVMISACFNAKQYEMALRSISTVACFLQANNHFVLQGKNAKIQVEPVNLSTSELSNLWSINGNQYYPSLFCLMRNVLIDSDEINRLDTRIRQI
ncbi:MAG: DUF4255 domain-containing protein [Prevotellaceae bacterium]|jgi:hypothetical protein|nr:DUF4255 domain-containing protein [Prevotellaceae bacterium]